MNKKKIILIGGGEHCKVVISQVEKLSGFEIVGLIDNNKPKGRFVRGVKVVGTNGDLKSFHKERINYALITIGSVKDNIKRLELFNMVKEIGFKFPVVISPDAIVDKSVEIGNGTIIMPGCVINADVSIGKNCIINTGAIVEHDCKIGNHCHIAPGVHLSGGIKIGNLSLIGIGSTIIQGIRVGKNVTVGAGSVVTKNIQDNVTVVGNPAEQLIRG